MQQTPTLKGLFEDTVQLESGLLVPRHSATDLIKSEAAKLQKESKKYNPGAFFSRYGINQSSTIWGARDKPVGTPHFEMLYDASERSVIDAVIIRNRIDQVKRIWKQAFEGSKEPGFRVVHVRNDDKDYKVTKGDKERCLEMEKVLGDPTPDKFKEIFPYCSRPHNRLKDFVSVVTQAELIIDRKVMRRYKRRDGQGYSAFHWLPGATIKPVDEALKEWARQNEKGGQITNQTIQKMSESTMYIGKYGQREYFDLTKADFVQIVDGMIAGAYTSDEISIHISNPSERLNRYGYGRSRLEISIELTTQLMFAFTYNRELFKTNYPEALLTVSGDYDPAGLQAFKEQLLQEAGGVGQNWRLPVIPAGDVENFKLETHKLRDTPKDMLFQEMIQLLCVLKCSAYGAHPQSINLSTSNAGSGNPNFGSDPASEIEFSDEQGLIPMVDDMADWLTDTIVSPTYDDLKVIVVNMKSEDEKQAIEIRTSRVSKWRTKNETRMEEGDSPIGFFVTADKVEGLSEEDRKKYDQNPWNYPADVACTNYLTILGGQNQQEDQEDEEEGSDDEYYKSMRKSHSGREKKFLTISLEDQ